MNQKMAEAVTLAKMTSTADVDEALGVAAVHGRFANKDLASILNAAGAHTSTHVAGETKSLTQGTAGWAAIGRVGLEPDSNEGAGLEESA